MSWVVYSTSKYVATCCRQTTKVGWEMEFLQKALVSTYGTTSSLPRVTGCLLSERQGSNFGTMPSRGNSSAAPLLRYEPYCMQLVRWWCVPHHSNSVRDTDWRSLFPLVSPPRPGEAVNANALPAYGVDWLSSWRMSRKAA